MLDLTLVVVPISDWEASVCAVGQQHSSRTSERNQTCSSRMGNSSCLSMNLPMGAASTYPGPRCICGEKKCYSSLFTAGHN